MEGVIITKRGIVRTNGAKLDHTWSNEARWGQMEPIRANQGQTEQIGAYWGKLGQTGYNGTERG